MVQAFPKLRGTPFWPRAAALSLLAAIVGMAIAAPAFGAQRVPRLTPKFTEPTAFDVSDPLWVLAVKRKGLRVLTAEEREIRPEPMTPVQDRGFSGDGAVQGPSLLAPSAAIPSPLTNFEGLNNTDNFNIFGFRVNPPDPVGAVGPNHYVQMINLVFAVYSKTGALLLGPT